MDILNSGRVLIAVIVCLLQVKSFNYNLIAKICLLDTFYLFKLYLLHYN